MTDRVFSGNGPLKSRGLVLTGSTLALTLMLSGVSPCVLSPALAQVPAPAPVSSAPAAPAAAPEATPAGPAASPAVAASSVSSAFPGNTDKPRPVQKKPVKPPVKRRPILPIIAFVLVLFAIAGVGAWKAGLLAMLSGEKRPPPGYLRQADTTDEYGQLLAMFGLNYDASESEIKQAYRKAMKVFHPDLKRAQQMESPGNKDSASADAVMKLTETYDRVMEIRKSMFGTR